MSEKERHSDGPKFMREVNDILMNKGVLIGDEVLQAPARLSFLNRFVLRNGGLIFGLTGLLITAGGFGTCTAGLIEDSNLLREAERMAESQASKIYPAEEPIDKVSNPAEYSKILQLREERGSYTRELGRAHFKTMPK